MRQAGAGFGQSGLRFWQSGAEQQVVSAVVVWRELISFPGHTAPGFVTFMPNSYQALRFSFNCWTTTYSTEAEARSALVRGKSKLLKPTYSLHFCLHAYVVHEVTRQRWSVWGKKWAEGQRLGKPFRLVIERFLHSGDLWWGFMKNQISLYSQGPILRDLPNTSSPEHLCHQQPCICGPSQSGCWAKSSATDRYRWHMHLRPFLVSDKVVNRMKL